MNTPITLYWLRHDLRVADNPALAAAMKDGQALAVYILDENRLWPLGGASRWWLHYSLTSLEESLKALGVPLILRRGDPAKLIPALVEETGATALHWSRLYDAPSIARDKQLKESLGQSIKVESHNSALLHEPWTVKTKTGGFYKVFTPYSKVIFASPAPALTDKPKKQIPPTTIPPSDKLDAWLLLPTKPDWAGGLRNTWQPGEDGAYQRLHDFADHIVSNYATGRDIPAKDYTSHLSPHLAFGELSPRQIWHAVEHAADRKGTGRDRNHETFLKELIWREFSYHLLYHLPQLPEKPLDERFAAFPWEASPARGAKNLQAWQRGATGYPIVDAGMRQLWQTGWMHNRVRMIVASFLIKHLLLPWQEGEKWFWDTLVDADIASNSASWQWVAGCGADAAPYFRIFNPMLQGAKFDPQGEYVRTFVPELAKLPDKYIHAPWEAPADILAYAGVKLGEAYPKPIVDHAAARARALAAFEELKGNA